MACNQRKREDTQATDDSPLNNPFVLDGVAQRSNECNSNDEMCKRQPVRTITDERILLIGVFKSPIGLSEPIPGKGREEIKMLIKECQFRFQRKSSDAT